jgi:TonB family protein
MNLKKPAFEKWVDTLVELRRPLLLIVLLWGCSLALMLVSTVAKAEVRCNCAEVIESCSASVNLNAMQVEIESNGKACARIDYLVDGQPFTALLTDGTADLQLNWAGPPLQNPKVIVESCRVCADVTEDVAASLSAASIPSAVQDDSGAESIVKVMPVYPREAWTNRIEGTVTMEFSINTTGQVESSNSLFNANSREALSRFRFVPAQKDGKSVAVTSREQFRFQMPDGINPVVTSSDG